MLVAPAIRVQKPPAWLLLPQCCLWCRAEAQRTSQSSADALPRAPANSCAVPVPGERQGIHLQLLPKSRHASSYMCWCWWCLQDWTMTFWQLMADRCADSLPAAMHDTHTSTARHSSARSYSNAQCSFWLQLAVQQPTTILTSGAWFGSLVGGSVASYNSMKLHRAHGPAVYYLLWY